MTSEHADVGGHRTNDAGGLAVVHWRYPSGAVGRGSPLPRGMAVLMERIYASQWRDRIFWTVNCKPDGGL